MELEQAKLEDYAGDLRQIEAEADNQNDDAALDQLHRVHIFSSAELSQEISTIQGRNMISDSDSRSHGTTNVVGISTVPRLSGFGTNLGHESTSNHQQIDISICASKLVASMNGGQDVLDGNLGQGPWNVDPGFPPVLVGRYIARRRHDIDKQEVLLQLSELDSTDLCPIVASCQLALSVFYARSIILHLLSLLSCSRDTFSKPEGIKCQSEIKNDNEALKIFHPRIFLTAIRNNNLPVTIEMLKTVFKQHIHSSFQFPDQIFPCIQYGSGIFEIRDRIPSFPSFIPSHIDNFSHMLSHLEQSLFSSSLGSLASDDSFMQTIPTIQNFIELLYFICKESYYDNKNELALDA